MATYKTPGVYVQEVSTLPPSVAAVSTAIPAFIGYTAQANDNGEDLTSKPTRINSLPEYTRLFGDARLTSFTVTKNAAGELSVRKQCAKDYLMYYALKMYFSNGGGPAYIVSVGRYTQEPTWKTADFEKGIDSLKMEDEPTLIVLTDAVNLGHTEYLRLCRRALEQCGELKDRMTILDVPQGSGESKGSDQTAKDTDTFRSADLGEYLRFGAGYYPYLQTTITCEYDESTVIVDGAELSSLRTDETFLYNQVRAELTEQRVVLPPSCAVAGIYAKVDRERGVWKAPANVGVAATIAPTLKITPADQELLNVDPTAGRSINAIRSFIGKGTLVWGARTLAGNDNEWRYINVRRLFNMIEESTWKATAFAVFEANDATTWLKVKDMIESFLYGLWEQGALAGPTPESAYFVNVGLGKTMTSQDILEGRMTVEIGVAAVRPAEFIIIRFSHKLQEA